MTMKNLMKSFVLAAVMAFSPAVWAEFTEGHEYLVLDSQPPVAKNQPIEVVEFFWYGCPHCFDFEPHIKNWLASKPADVKFVQVPVTFNKPAKLHARMFYALDLMDVDSKVHESVFIAMHQQGNRLDTMPKIEAFLQQQGVDIATFRKAIKSFAVQTKVGQAGSMFRKYGLRGVPAVVVSGRYRTGNVRNFQQMVEVIDYLVATVREEKKTSD